MKWLAQGLWCSAVLALISRCSYDSNAGIIQCTKCAKLQVPFRESSDVKCKGCSASLTHPITARVIQCPQCLELMDVSDPAEPRLELVEIIDETSSNCDFMDDSSDSNVTISTASESS